MQNSTQGRTQATPCFRFMSWGSFLLPVEQKTGTDVFYLNKFSLQRILD